jgi:gentisate 1,2-dioxygenase
MVMAAANLAPSFGAREAMERLNAEAGKFHIWLRTQANAPAQRPWFRETEIEASGQIAAGRVGAAQLKPVAHRWQWSEIAPYLDRIAEIARGADVSPIEFAERQQFLLTNPGLGGRLQVTSTMRCAVSIYNPGDVAPVHIHTPNASRTILSDRGGYTTIEGERCEAARGDLILTPNGTWHDHGNDGSEPVVWVDVLDFPLMEFLDCVWLDEAFPGATQGNSRAQAVTHGGVYSQRLYGQGGLVPRFVPHRRGFGRDTTPMFHYRGADVREALDGLRQEEGDPYEAIALRFVNPATGASLFPTLDYGALLLRPGEATRLKRETASTLYIAMEGEGVTEIAGQRLDWRANDIFVVPSFAWRRHVSKGGTDAVLYTVSDAPLIEKIGQYRAQGRLPDDTVAELVP